MPLFASFDSIYTEPTSDALPEFSLALHEQNPNSIHEQNPNSMHEQNPNSIHDNLHGNRTNWDVICDVGTCIKQTSVIDTVVVNDIKGEARDEDHSDWLCPAGSDNRFVFEPLNAMTSFGDSLDPGLDGANGFKPREVAAVDIGEPPDPKLWLHTLG